MRFTVDDLRRDIRYSPIVGVFEWKTGASGRRKGFLAGGVNKETGYISVGYRGRQYKAHVLAWCYMKGEWPDKEIDHIDGDRSNNAWKNLRLADRHQNSFNKKSVCHDDPLDKGISFRKDNGKWQARVYCRGSVWSACYETKEEARAAATAKRKELHKEFANHGIHRYVLEEMAS